MTINRTMAPTYRVDTFVAGERGDLLGYDLDVLHEMAAHCPYCHGEGCGQCLPRPRATAGEIAFRNGLIWAAILLGLLALNGCGPSSPPRQYTGGCKGVEAGALVQGAEAASLCAPDGAPGDRASLSAAIGHRHLERLRGSAESRTSPNRTPSPGQRVAGVDGSTRAVGAKVAPHGEGDSDGLRRDTTESGPALGRRGSEEGGPPTPSAAANVLSDLDRLGWRLVLNRQRVELWKSWSALARRDGAPMVRGNRAEPRRAR